MAASHAGPAIVASYIVAGLACIFVALSYAELAASIGDVAALMVMPRRAWRNCRVDHWLGPSA